MWGRGRRSERKEEEEDDDEEEDEGRRLAACRENKNPTKDVGKNMLEKLHHH